MTRRSSCRPNAVCQRLSGTTCSGRDRPSRLTRGERAEDFFHVQIHLTPTPISSLEHGTHDARICTSATSTARSHLGGIARDTRVELDVHPICAAPARSHGALRGHPGPPHTHIHKIYIIYSQRASKIRYPHTRRPLRGRPVRMARFMRHLRGVSSKKTTKKNL